MTELAEIIDSLPPDASDDQIAAMLDARRRGEEVAAVRAELDRLAAEQQQREEAEHRLEELKHHAAECVATTDRGPVRAGV